jgi:hypothetical protein
MDHGRTGKPGWKGNMEDKVTRTDRDKPLMRDYWGKYRARVYIVITAAQSATMLLLFAILELLGIMRIGWLAFFLLAFVAAVILNAITITFVHLLGRPFRDLIQAIVLFLYPANRHPPRHQTQIRTNMTKTGSEKFCKPFMKWLRETMNQQKCQLP